MLNGDSVFPPGVIIKTGALFQVYEGYGKEVAQLCMTGGQVYVRQASSRTAQHVHEIG
jgi:hypothetical protein